MTRKVIDDEIFRLQPRPLRPPWRCDKCGTPDKCRAFSHRRFRGRLYFTYWNQTGFDPSQTLMLCDDCWPRWLMWRARMGYDLHDHSLKGVCGAECLAQRGGRRAQFNAQMSLFGSRTAFYAQKDIDGLPSYNGSHLIMAERTSYFMYRGLTRQHYYESIGNVEELVRQMQFNGQLHEMGLPQYALDDHLIVFEAFESSHHAPGGVICEPRASEKSLGLHCVMVSGYEDNGNRLSFLNSWGPSWGVKGYGSVSTDYLSRHFHEAFVTRRARWGLSPWKFANVPLRSLSTRAMRQRLIVENPRRVLEVRDKVHGEIWKVELYQTTSPTTQEPVDCLCVRNGFGLRMGWTFVRHRIDSDPRVSEILEMFVWPTFRRLGIATGLEELAVECANSWGSTGLELMLHEADAVVGPPRSAARGFAEARSYKWKWHNKVAPRRTGTAVKAFA
jgi:GNAT superfamily N-acetyltransferase